MAASDEDIKNDLYQAMLDKNNERKGPLIMQPPSDDFYEVNGNTDSEDNEMREEEV